MPTLPTVPRLSSFVWLTGGQTNDATCSRTTTTTITTTTNTNTNTNTSVNTRNISSSTGGLRISCQLLLLHLLPLLLLQSVRQTACFESSPLGSSAITVDTTSKWFSITCLRL